MVKGLNKVMLIGNLGADPEVCYTPNGTPVATFRLATSRNIKKDDNWEEVTDWHRVVAWRGFADVVQKYCHKGSKVFVEGSLRTRSWEDKDGVKRYVTEVMVRDLVLLSSKGGSGAAGEDPGADVPLPAEDGDISF